MKPTLLVLSAALLAACAPSPGAGRAPSDPPAGIENLGLAALEIIGSGNLWVATVGEEANGAGDLNFDGDAEDVVLFTYDVARGELTNLHVALSQLPSCPACLGRGEEGDGHSHAGADIVPPPLPIVNGTRVAFVTDEYRQGGQDLNGDGDANDAIVVVHDTETGETIGLGLAVAAYGTAGLALEGDLMAFAVNEQAQGEQDLNGDGDAYDLVLHLYDVRIGRLTNTQVDLGSSELLFEAGQLVYFARESLTTGDLNGDLDTGDVSVFHLLDIESRVVTNSGLAALGSPPLYVDGTWTLLVPEASQGNQDLNGDTDRLDLVYHTFDPAAGGARNLRVASRSPYGAQADRHRLGLSIDERSQDEDLNGDGDKLDAVPLVIDVPAGLSRSTKVATGIQPAQIFVGDQLALAVSEFSQGNQDLNGDGDALDMVVHLHDPATGVTTNLGLDGLYLSGGGRWLFIQRSEQSSGVDFNGDGDKDDRIFFTGDSQTRRLAQMPRSNVGLMDFGYDVALILVGEFFEKDDLNGDGDQTDVLLTAVDLVSGAHDILPLAPLQARLVSADQALVLVNERGMQQDLNGDGDMTDRVLFDVALFASRPGS